jgi:sec-independent protein translocase protein TatB
MLNVGPLELLVVLAVALIVVGPERLPELARSIGRALRQLREVQDEVRNMVTTGVDDDIRDAAAEFKKVTGSIKRATDVKGAVRRADQGIRQQAASSKQPARDAASEAGEAAGPPADRLVEDAAADPESPAQRSEPAPSGGHAGPADQTEPETPSRP